MRGLNISGGFIVERQTNFPWADAVTIGDSPVELRRHICRLCGWGWYEECDKDNYPYYCPGCGEEYDAV